MQVKKSLIAYSNGNIVSIYQMKEFMMCWTCNLEDVRNIEEHWIGSTFESDRSKIR